MRLAPGIPRLTALLPGGGRIEILGGQLTGDQPAHYRIVQGDREWLLPAATVLIADTVPLTPVKEEEPSPAETNGVAT